MKKHKRGAPARRRKAQPCSVSLVVRDKTGRLPQAWPQPLAAPPILVSEPVMIATFVGTLKLTKDQIDALRRPVEDREIEWKPAVQDGPPIIPYLSHNGYRDRLDAAFGLGGWGMVPVGMPKEKDGAIFTPYALVIDGVPRVYAWGEQQQHKMSYGDALEGAKSNAILRCGKELGIARELWSRSNIASLKARLLRGADPRTATEISGATPAVHLYPDAHAAEKISEPQRKRLFAIAKSAGRTKPELAVWLQARYSLASTADITRGRYNQIISEIERRGPLPQEPAE